MQQDLIEGFRLSPQQKHIWLLQQEHKQQPYWVQRAVLIEGDLRQDVLQTVLEQVVERFEILRTAFQRLPGMALPLQVVTETAMPLLATHDLSEVPDSREATRVNALLQKARQEPFDPEAGTVLRASLIVRDSQRHILLLTLPALCADAEAANLLVQEISRTYAACLQQENVDPEDEPLQYIDLAEWLNELMESEDAEAGKAYWRDKLGVSQRATLPSEQDLTSDAGFDPERFPLAITPDLSSKLETFSQKQGESVSDCLLAAWQVLLGRLTGKDDQVVGVELDGRKYKELAAAVGPLARCVPVRVHLEGGISFARLLEQTREAVREAEAWQEYFDETACEGEAESFFSYGFHYEKAPEQHTSGSVTFSSLATYECIGQFKVKLACRQQEGALDVALYYDDALFEKADIERLAGRLLALLEDAVERPKVVVEALNILAEEERRHILGAFNETKTGFPKEKGIHELFEEQVVRTPEQPAVAFEDQSTSYAELNACANQLARRLHTLGVGPDVLVGLCVERSIDMVVGILGILKAGGAYVPMDPSYPQERLGFMLEDTQVPVLLTQAHLVEGLPDHKAQVMCLDADWEQIAREQADNPAYEVPSESLAYVIYTSGSTGNPKGVLVTHQNLVHSTTARFDVYSEPVNAFLLLSSFAFDSSVAGIFWTLSQGGSLALPPEEIGSEPAHLAEAIDRHGVSHMLCIPSLYRFVLDAATQQQLASLRTVIVAGEACPPNLVEQHRACLPETPLFNEYGPTEGTVWSSVYDCRHWNAEVQQQSPTVPIGHPIADTQLYILDAHLNPVPIGTQGELYVGGAGVAKGYLGRPELTAEHFIADSFSQEMDARLYKTGDLGRYLPDGTIEFLGRRDDQIKLRGYRIELGEIEAVLHQHPAVHEAAVIVREHAPGDLRLAAYLVPDEQHAYAVRQQLLPENQELLKDRTLYHLPNGMAIAHQNKNETDFIYGEIFEEQTYLQQGIILEKGACVFDVGANIGLFTLLVNQTCEDATVYAFEPIPSTFEALRINAALYAPGAKVFECGLSNETTEAVFTHYRHVSLISGRYADGASERNVIKSFLVNQQSSGDGAVFTGEQLDALLTERLQSEQVTCQLRTLSSIIHEESIERIDLLKIDVEKSELDVLAGIDDDDWSKIRQIAMELEDIDGALNRVESLLQQRGFKLKVEQDAMLEATPLYKIFATRPVEEKATNTFAPSSKQIAPIWYDLEEVTSNVRGFLQEKLPGYMVPPVLVLLHKMPRTPNGKVDRHMLPAPDQVKSDTKETYVAPHTPEEKRLAKVWADVLSIERVGVQDDFFDLGGHSLLAVKLFSEIQREFEKKLPLSALFEAPTVGQLARMLEDNAAEIVEGSSLVTIQPKGTRPPLFCVHGPDGSPFMFAKLAKQLGPDQPVYALQGQGLDGTDVVDKTAEEIAKKYAAQVRSFYPEGPYFLISPCIGSIIALEMARHLKKEGGAVGLIAFIDAVSPTLPRVRKTMLGKIKEAVETEGVYYLLQRIKAALLYRVKRSRRMIDRGLSKILLAMNRPVPERHRWDYIVDSYGKILHTHVPAPYEGGIILFRSTKNALRFPNRPSHHGWTDVAQGGVEVHEIEGPHGLHKHPTSVSEVARILRGCMDKALLEMDTEALTVSVKG